MENANKAELADAAVRHGVPEHLIGGLCRYIFDRISPGNFLSACLRNDLFTAVSRADPDSFNGLPNICSFIHWEIPIESWGSREAVKKWLNSEMEVDHVVLNPEDEVSF